MAIRYAPPPEGAEAVASAGLVRVTRTARLKTAGAAMLSMNPPEQLALTAPHAVHNVGLDAIVQRQSLAGAPRTSWRYLVDAGGGAVASTEVALDDAGQLAFAQMNEGPFVGATARVLGDIEQRPEVASGDFEVRLLRVPALYVVALWLKDLAGDNDLIVPLDPAPPYLQAGRVYREAEFYDALAGPAQEKLSFDDSPRD